MREQKWKESLVKILVFEISLEINRCEYEKETKYVNKVNSQLFLYKNYEPVVIVIGRFTFPME